LALWELKGVLKDRDFSSIDEMEEAIAEIWNDLNFDDVQSVLPGSLKTEDSIRENKRDFACSSSANVEIGEGPGTFFTPCIRQMQCCPKDRLIRASRKTTISSWPAGLHIIDHHV
jgi:hypothetical protein